MFARKKHLVAGTIPMRAELAWRRPIEVQDADAPTSAPRTYALFPEDRCAAVSPHESIDRLKLKSLQLHRPRQSDAPDKRHRRAI
jgi:hypothetical protein